MILPLLLEKYGIKQDFEEVEKEIDKLYKKLTENKFPFTVYTSESEFDINSLEDVEKIIYYLRKDSISNNDAAKVGQAVLKDLFGETVIPYDKTALHYLNYVTMPKVLSLPEKLISNEESELIVSRISKATKAPSVFVKVYIDSVLRISDLLVKKESEEEIYLFLAKRFNSRLNFKDIWFSPYIEMKCLHPFANETKKTLHGTFDIMPAHLNEEVKILNRQSNGEILKRIYWAQMVGLFNSFLNDESVAGAMLIQVYTDILIGQIYPLMKKDFQRIIEEDLEPTIEEKQEFFSAFDYHLKRTFFGTDENVLMCNPLFNDYLVFNNYCKEKSING